MEGHVKKKKDKYLQACLDRRRTFTPLLYSVDGMACKEARSFEKRIASLLADKWDRSYSELVGYVRGRMAMSILRSNNVCLRGAPGKEAGGAVDGGWRHLRGDAGVDGGL